MPKDTVTKSAQSAESAKSPAAKSDSTIDLVRKFRFESLLLGFSSTFINLPAEKVDTEIEHWLKRVVQFIELDAGIIIQGEGKGELMQTVITHAGMRPSLPTLTTPAPLEEHCLIADQLLSGELVAFSSLSEFSPEDLEECRLILRNDINSMVGFPFSGPGGAYSGAVIFATIGREIQWTDHIRQRLWLVSQVFANALLRKRTEEDARDLRSQLSHVDRVSTMGQLAASLAHEINQPLAAILSNAQAALRLLDSPNPDLAEIREALGDIVNDDRRAGQVIAGIRSFLRGDETKLSPLSVNELIAEVIALLQREITSKGVSITQRFGRQLPLVAADRTQLQQVILNLTMNAAEAMSGGDVSKRSLTIQTSAPDSAHVTVSFSDTGSGFDAKTLETLFQPFYTTKKQGMGMGLSICKSLIEAHGGSLTAENIPSGGATLQFTLPVAAKTL